MEPRTKRKRGYTHVSSKRQVTIPAAVLSGLGLTAGDALRIEPMEDGIFLRAEETVATRRMKALHEASGSMTGMYGPDYLKNLRSEWG